MVEGGRVSILVLVDEGHRLGFAAAGGGVFSLFQSLFSWMKVIGILTGSLTSCRVLEFQSLFSWMKVIGPADHSYLTNGALGFQSLFSWMKVIGRDGRGGETDRWWTNGFNPCSRG